MAHHRVLKASVFVANSAGIVNRTTPWQRLMLIWAPHVQAPTKYEQQEFRAESFVRAGLCPVGSSRASGPRVAESVCANSRLTP